jgi:hypothetical protein
MIRRIDLPQKVTKGIFFINGQSRTIKLFAKMFCYGCMIIWSGFLVFVPTNGTVRGMPTRATTHGCEWSLFALPPMCSRAWIANGITLRAVTPPASYHGHFHCLWNAPWNDNTSYRAAGHVACRMFMHTSTDADGKKTNESSAAQNVAIMAAQSLFGTKEKPEWIFESVYQYVGSSSASNMHGPSWISSPWVLIQRYIPESISTAIE